jgi:hypothetical protein
VSVTHRTNCELKDIRYNKQMSTTIKGINSFFAGFYAWIVTIYFGAILLDILYSNLVPQAVTAFSEVSDFLLLIGFVTILAAIGAIGLSWESRIARNFFIASLVIIALEFTGPLFLSQLIQNTQRSLLTIGIRVFINGSASILAFIGLYNLYRR